MKDEREEEIARLGLSRLSFRAEDDALKSNRALSALMERDFDMMTPIGIEEVCMTFFYSN